MRAKLFAIPMFYSIVGRNLSGGLVTADGLVVRATENFAWACGAPVEDVLRWADSHEISWSASAIVPAALLMLRFDVEEPGDEKRRP